MVADMAQRDPTFGVTVYDRRARPAGARSYADMSRRARAWASWLRERGVQPGEVLFICLPTSLDLIEAFLGAALLRALPCCLALPRAIGGLDAFRRRVEKVGERFPGGHLITTPDVGAELGRDHFTVPDDLEAAGQLELEPVDPGDLAYVQLTSGSTQAPKAVAITHANLAANTDGTVRWGQATRRDTLVSWLPLYHDMGLVGMLFSGLLRGINQVLMPPEAFVGSPLRWLKAIAAQETTVITTAPNFGYQWCVDRIPPGKEQGLDLSNWRLALCGAEMVRPATLDQFCARFGPCGFRRESFKPCYGMAETTLAVTFSPLDRGPRIHDGRVSCGSPMRGLTVEVRHPESGEPLAEGDEGEVVVKGSSVFAGYHLDPQATAAVLDDDGSLHTGDLGYLHEGELFITGRLKDLLILDGVNVAPYELEWLAQEHLPMEGGRAAAFSVEVEGRERAVLAVEVKAVPADEAMTALRRQVGSDFAPLHELVLVRRGTLPKTSSGKVRRRRIKELYQRGALEAVLWRSADQTESK
jgi:acyl-CoA synthetase (AMP-forming)/AMP-acid ligase II